MLVKEEISTIVNSLPEDFQKELLEYLKKLEKISLTEAKTSLHLNTILSEDREVLTRLAK